MVLSRDLDTSRSEFFDGLIEASMTKLQLVRFPTQGQAKELVSEANTKNRLLPKEGLHGFDAVAHRRRVAGAV